MKGIIFIFLILSNCISTKNHKHIFLKNYKIEEEKFTTESQTKENISIATILDNSKISLDVLKAFILAIKNSKSKYNIVLKNYKIEEFNNKQEEIFNSQTRYAIGPITKEDSSKLENLKISTFSLSPTRFNTKNLIETY